MQLLSPTHFPDYELIDCGEFEKLERFGKYITIRPEPQAVWKRKMEYKEWEKCEESLEKVELKYHEVNKFKK